jgi:hypothetical protein
VKEVFITPEGEMEVTETIISMENEDDNNKEPEM